MLAQVIPILFVVLARKMTFCGSSTDPEWSCNPDASTIIAKDYGQHCVQIFEIYSSDDW